MHGYDYILTLHKYLTINVPHRYTNPLSWTKTRYSYFIFDKIVTKTQPYVNSLKNNTYRHIKLAEILHVLQKILK